jgi:hypothetical protein
MVNRWFGVGQFLSGAMGQLYPGGDNGILQENILFRSPSYAAAFVIGGHVNGLIEWKTIDGVSLKEIENSEEN